ncbi:MAG: DUF2911 domain-containing protein [Flavisolibacter sp.]|jgi:hypothetical protein|nr:DUF2911 domain-containing protein [Flavisolibacter sp.]
MQLKKIISLLLITCSVVTVSQAQQDKKVEEICYNPNAKGDTSKRSIKSAAVGKIGDANITINYHSPGVRGRTIWGGLVPYDDVWVTGAHFATNIEIDKDITVSGTAIPKGKYAIFTIPAKDEWIIIINKNWNQHLTDDYLQQEDVVRIQVKPEQLDEKVERLQYFIEDDKDGKGSIAMAWEKVKVKFYINTTR